MKNVTIVIFSISNEKLGSNFIWDTNVACPFEEKKDDEKLLTFDLMSNHFNKNLKKICRKNNFLFNQPD